MGTSGPGAKGVKGVASAMVAALVSLSACGGAVDVPSADVDDPGTTTGNTASEQQRGHAVDPQKELVITDLSVIESPEETTFDPARPSGTARKGAWSFGRLVHNMLPRGQRDDARAASRMMYAWLGQLAVDEQPNPAVALSPARPRVRDEILDPWKRASGCADAPDDACVLDMGHAPFRLIAIVYRPDLRILGDRRAGEPGIGGEGRFVFELMSQTATEAAPSVKKMTVIFEYSLPIRFDLETLAWAQRFHVLGNLPFGPVYNAWLRTLTDGFSGPDADRRRPNGNALDQLRTNELRLVFPTPGDVGKRWELREFHLEADGLRQAPVGQEPSRDFDVVARPVGTGARSAELGDFILANAAAIQSNTHVVPEAWLANSSLVGSKFPAWGDTGTKNSDGTALLRVTASDGTVVPEKLRKAFAVQTCAGCHRHETDTKSFLHLTDRRVLDPADPNDNANLPPAPTPDSERQTVLSKFLQDEIAAPSAERPNGGDRYADYVQLLAAKPFQIFEKKGGKACRGRYR